MSHLMNTYNRQPVSFTHGQGVWLWDNTGKKYLDALAGIAVSGLGHTHPKLIRALNEQAGKLIHTSNLYHISEQEALSEQLALLSGMQEVFFCNSGSEANEGAIKLARLYGHQRGNSEAQIVVMKRAWHGRTLATLAATGNEKAKQGFGPLPGGFIQIEYNDLAAIERLAEHEPRINAVLLEVLQGEGGIRLCSLEYLRGLRKFCDDHGWLLMIDEVQSGVGRTGKWFAHQHANITPDVMTLAKGLASGLPLGAVLAAGKAVGTFTPGTHGTTFGGGPLASVASLSTLQIMAEEDLLQNAITVGGYLRTALAHRLEGIAGVVDIRGQGMMIGIELDRPCGEIVHSARHAGLLINVTSEKVIRLLPPLIMTMAEADLLVTGLTPLICAFLGQTTSAGNQ